MSRKTPGRRLQRLAEDELGIRPKLMTCHNIMRDAERDPTHSTEEHIAVVFLANRERLKVSAEDKARHTEEVETLQATEGGGK